MSVTGSRPSTTVSGPGLADEAEARRSLVLRGEEQPDVRNDAGLGLVEHPLAFAVADSMARTAVGRTGRTGGLSGTFGQLLGLPADHWLSDHC